MSLADRIAVMDLGVLQQVGPPEEVYHHPANLLVAGFIGNPPMNFMKGTIQNGKDGPLFEHSIFRYPLQAYTSAVRGLTSRKLVLGVRPEEIELVGDSGGDEGISGQVMMSELLGRRTLISVQVGEDLLRIEAPQDVEPAVAETIGLQFKPDAVRFFDAETGRALTPSP